MSRAPVTTRCGCGMVSLEGFASCSACVARNRFGRPIDLADERERDVTFDPDPDQIEHGRGPRAAEMRVFALAGGGGSL